MPITYSKSAAKAISHMDTSTKQRIKAAIEKLPAGNIKQLAGRKTVTYHLRVGGWRVLYSFCGDGAIFIEKIAPRREVYKEG